ncbi:AraC family transcriptional regulator [Streptomyces sp. WAC06614]|uniref:AraC family transcriptional regulator n=1 Tax=Streptomyces sp. WAC06614 TaxID=2487416 RepID=UPI000F7AB909|nr:AraC family transcriptional regulator [Streptomyces sp. WAC06614]RSS80073.1 AraC family transcriptional regulator [Streptomyces sp. WAC06614]
MLDRLNQAMEHIERHLDQAVDGQELARIAATSEHHLRRMFSALAGMPLSEYIRRRRLTVAGADVLAGRETLLEIAVRYGYGSGEAFARAFRAMHGIGPGEARRTGATLSSQPRMAFRLTVEGSSSMRYRIVDRADFTVVGFSTRVPLVHEGPNRSIIAFVRGIAPRALELLDQLSDQEPRGVVAVCDGMDPSRAEGTALDYHHGVITSAPAPEGMTTLAVPAGTWAVFTTSGPAPRAVQELWRDVFTEWFPSNPYRTRPGPEIARIRLSPDGTEADAELWLPVEPDHAQERRPPVPVAPARSRW